MATFYLCNNVQVGAVKYWAGRLINDVVDPAVGIRNAGGLLWPAADTVVAAAAVIASKMKVRGSQPPGLVADIMMAAVQNASISGGTVAGVQKQTVTIGFAQLTAAALTQSLPIGGLLPANARIISREIRLPTAFSGGAIATMTLSVGLAPTGTEIANAANVFTGAPAAQKGADGTDPNEFLLAASQLNATFTSTVGNVNVATAGSVTIDVMYIVEP